MVESTDGAGLYLEVAAAGAGIRAIETETPTAKALRTQSFRKGKQKQTNGHWFLRFSLRFLGPFAPLRWTFDFDAIALGRR